MISQVVACCMGGSKHHIGHPGLNTIGLGVVFEIQCTYLVCHLQTVKMNATLPIYSCTLWTRHPNVSETTLMFRMWKCPQLVIIWPSYSTNISDNWLPQLAYLRHCPRAYKLGSYSCKTHRCVKLKAAIPLILWQVGLHCCLIRTQANYLCRKCLFQLWGVLQCLVFLNVLCTRIYMYMYLWTLFTV